MFSLLRGSGLKFPIVAEALPNIIVLPLTREWIEIQTIDEAETKTTVLPLTREWIEINPPTT